MSVRHLTITERHAGQRLDNFLLGELKGAPRSLVYRLIRSGQVRVNKGRAKVSTRLAAGDVVRVPPVRLGEREAPRVPQSLVTELRAAVISEDAHFIVVDKPAGLAVHGGSGIRYGVIDALREAYGADIELAHRLDRETSGCLVLARHREALLAAQAAFAGRSMQKRYFCVVHGQLREEKVIVDIPLRRGAEMGGERLVVVDEAEGKSARSEFWQVEKLGRYSLLEVRITTGRTHQIRVHAAHLGLPIVGDRKYGEGEEGPLYLHCGYLAFEQDGYELNVSAPLPESWAPVLRQ